MVLEKLNSPVSTSLEGEIYIDFLLEEYGLRKYGPCPCAWHCQVQGSALF
jgi:hypothetical protein